MARQIQIRRGTTLENDNFTGAIGEITMDTDAKTLRVHDGETVGGVPLAKESEILDKETILRVIMPDYTNAEDVITFPYVAQSYGWLIGHIYAFRGTAAIHVNNTTVVSVGSWSDSGQNFHWAIPLCPNDIVTKTDSPVDFAKFVPFYL